MCITPRRNARSAFTLVELLLVIAIIAVLAALTTAAVFRFRTTGPEMATRTNLNKLKGALDTQWNAVRSKAEKDGLPSDFLPLAQWADASIKNLQDPRARKTYVELKLAQAFPTSFAEALDPTNGYSSPPSWGQGYGTYKTFLKSLGITGGTSDPTQQAICLQMALAMGPLNNGVTHDVLGGSAAARLPVGSTTTYGCVDGWGNPLLFSRYTRKNPTNSDDKGDATATPPLPPNPRILQPVILSMGADAKAGVDASLTLLTSSSSPYTLLPNAQHGYDNLYTLPEWEKFLKP